MRIRSTVLAGLAACIALPLPAFAGPCDAYFALDGDLADASGSGHDGQMVGANGVPATPEFVEGRHGQGLKLDGSAAVRVFMDLAYDACPQVTVAAWINVEPLPNQMFFGASHGLHMMVSLAQMGLRSGGSDLWAHDAVFANGGWMYVAGVWDAETGRSSFHWRGRSVDGQVGTTRDGIPPAIYFGALNDSLHFPAKQMIIDELRIIGRALDATQIADLSQQAASTSVAAAASPAPAARATPAAAGGADCNLHDDCAAGSYCAVDGSCHPDSHLPRQADGSGTTFADMQAAMAERNAARGNVDYERPPLLPGQSGSSSSGTTLEEMRENFAQRNTKTGNLDYERAPDLTQESGSGQTIEEMRENFSQRNTDTGSLDYERTPDLLAAGGGDTNAPPEETEDPEEPQQPPSNGPTGGFGGMTIGEYIAQARFSKEPTGNVRDCTSFAEVVSDLATGFRDAVVELAATNSCGVLADAIHTSQAANYVSVESDYRSDQFMERLMIEVYEGCVASTTAASQIPDKMLAFWNNMVTKNSWATIGPRELEFGKTHTGNLISPGDRKFISTGPFLGRQSTSLGLQEIAGGARVNARVCTVSLNNHYRRVTSATINETPEERQNESQFLIVPLDNVQGRIVMVYLDAAGRLGRNFRYELAVD